MVTGERVLSSEPSSRGRWVGVPHTYLKLVICAKKKNKRIHERQEGSKKML